MTNEEKDALLKMIPQLPDDFKEWVMDLFDGEHIIFFSKPYKEILLECCHCSAKSFWTLKSHDFLANPWGDRKLPEEGDEAYCPYCEAAGRMIPKRNKRKPIVKEKDVWIGQKLNDGGKGGYVLRFFRVRLSSLPDRDECEEDLIFDEKIRYFFPVGMANKSYKLYYHDSYYNFYQSEWNTSYCFNSMSYWYQGPTRGYIYPGTYGEMKDTVMAYSCTEEMMEDQRHNMTIADWQQAYIKDRWLEMMYKVGLDGLISAKISRYRFPRCYQKAKKPWDYFRITKDRFKDLCVTPDAYQLEALRIFRLERKYGKSFGEDLTYFVNIGVDEGDLTFFTERMTLTKLRNYIAKQSKDGKAWRANDAIKEYKDYLTMKEKVGCDMENSITMFPKNLHQAHNKAVIESKEAEAIKRKAEVNRVFKGIELRFKGADKVYHYEDGKYLIRPAMDAAEIVEEGRQLHHCVGGNDYLSSHAKKESIICFVRSMKAPDVPFVTVEINPDCTIEQWYGINDSKPKKKTVNKFLNEYIKTRDPKKVLREAKKKIPAKAV